MLSEITSVALADLNPHFFHRDYVLKTTPCVIKGCDDICPTKTWSDDYLLATLGDQMVSVAYDQKGIFDYNSGTVTVTQMTFREALEIINSCQDGRYYIQQQSLAQHFHGLVNDFSAPALVGRTNMVRATNLWISAKGCCTPLHFDGSNNLLMQVRGTKHVRLYPPSATRLLYPAVGAKLSHCSRVNVFDVDHVQFPLFRYARAEMLECVLGPGEMLYIPVKWWHSVESTAMAISVNFWWDALRAGK